MTQWMKHYFSEISWRKFAISSVGLLTLMGVLIFAIYEATKTSVTVEVGNEIATVYTHASTVGEVLKERGIDVSVHDYIEPSENTAISEAMNIVYIPAQEVYVTINGEENRLWTISGTVQELMNELEVEVNEHDVIEPSLTEAITSDMSVIYEQSFMVTLSSDGEEKEIWTTSTTVADFLERENITLGELDRVEPDVEEWIDNSMEVNVVRVEKVTDVVEESIDFATVRRNDSSLEQGKEQVVQSGQSGQVKKHYEVVFENGKEVSRKLIKEEMVRDSEDRIVAVGTKAPAPTVARGSTGEWSKFTATKYTAFCPSGCTGVTATGINVSESIWYQGHRIIAVDPSVIPLHSLVEVKTRNETFTALALDTGGAIQGNKVDILVANRSEALRFGVQNIEVRVLRRGR